MVRRASARSVVVEQLGHRVVERDRLLVVDALELGQEVGVEDLVEQAAPRRLVLGPAHRELGGVEVHGRPEVAVLPQGQQLADDVARDPRAARCRPRRTGR